MDALLNPPSTTQPTFRGQSLYSTLGVYPLDEVNSLVCIPNILSQEEMSEYLSEAVKVQRVSGPSGFGHTKPRREVCYTPDGGVYKYSGKKHKTTVYPPHVLQLLERCLQKANALLSSSQTETSEARREKGDLRLEGTLSTAVDIIYDQEYARGGSISAHSDDEMFWKLVVIYSVGQTRYLRVRRKSDKSWYNVELSSNSLVAMVGPTFQTLYTHQVDKLSTKDTVGTRHSLNARYL